MKNARCNEDAGKLYDFLDVCISVLQIWVRCLKIYLRLHSLNSLTTSAVSVTEKLKTIQFPSLNILSYQCVHWWLRVHPILGSQELWRCSVTNQKWMPGQPKLTSACRQNIPWCPKVKVTMSVNKAWQDNNEHHTKALSHTVVTHLSTTLLSPLLNSSIFNNTLQQ